LLFQEQAAKEALAAELAARGLGTEDGKKKVRKVSVRLSLQCMAHICLPFYIQFMVNH
jgi:hypothetical protein